MNRFLTILIIILAVAALVLGTVFFRIVTNPYAPSAGREITRTENGFSPSRLVVYLGDKVTFRNGSGRDMWPASDPHPTHDIYPQFDPRRPIPGGDSWSFSFEKPGIWRFHDHLADNMTGEIVVLSKGGAVVVPSCDNATATESECFQADVVSVLRKSGLDSALDRMAYLYDTNPTFKDSCHSVAHILGKSAYHEFEAGKKITLSAKTSYCSYGFYHGFMEEMLQLSGNFDMARAFCGETGKTLSNESSNAEGACYHGIGHGASDGSDPRAWGDPVALATPGLKLCEKVDPTEPHFYRCASGVFNSLALMYIDHSYNLSLGDANPFDVCKNWTDPRIKKPCYGEMNTLVMSITKDDVARAIPIIEEVRDDPEFLAWAMKSVSGVAPRSFTAPYDADFKKTIDACHVARKDLVTACIEGVPSGIMEAGDPGREYVPALAFCASASLNDAERSACYTSAFGGIRAYYPKEKVTSICNSVDEKFRTDCISPR